MCKCSQTLSAQFNISNFTLKECLQNAQRKIAM